MESVFDCSFFRNIQHAFHVQQPENVTYTRNKICQLQERYKITFRLPFKSFNLLYNTTHFIYYFFNTENCMREHVNEWVAGMNINRYMATLYYVTLGFFIMIVMFRHDSCSVAKAIIAIFLGAFDAVKKKG